MRVIRTVTGLIISIVLWQYLAIVVDDYKMAIYRPTDGIDFVTDICREGWRLLGEMAALISSFWELLDFSLLKQSLLHLLIAVKNVLWSPYQFLVGYIEVVDTFDSDDQLKIWLGSCTWILITTAGLIFYLYKCLHK